jgi:hypothetical protein
MARPCTICGRPDRAAIDAALRAGTPPSEVALQHPDAGARCIARHAASHHHTRSQVAAPPAAPPPRLSPTAPPASFAGSDPRAGPTAETPAVSVPVSAPPAEVPAPTAPANDAAPPPSERLPEGPPSEPRSVPPPEEEIPPTREAKVGHIMGLVAGGLWEDGESIRELARAWRMSQGSVAHIASEARRRVRSAIDPKRIGEIVATTCHRGLGAAVAMAEAGDSKALSGLAAIARVYKDLLPPTPEKTEEVPVFKVDLSEPERPPVEPPCPSSGSSSPPAGDPAPA